MPRSRASSYNTSSSPRPMDMRSPTRSWGGWLRSPPIRMLGGIGLRIGSSHSIEQYYGHLGYHVFPAARGRNYAQRACRLLLPLAKAHGIDPLWITCNPDNVASRTTCERLGAVFEGIVPVPPSDPLYLRGEHQKCRYRLDLSSIPSLRD